MKDTHACVYFCRNSGSLFTNSVFVATLQNIATVNIDNLYLIEDFCVYIHKRYWPVIFFFSYNFFIWLWNQDNAGLIEWARKCFLCISGKNLLIFLLTFGRIHQWSSLVLDFSLLRGFDFWFHLDIVLLIEILYFFLCSSGNLCVFLGICFI